VGEDVTELAEKYKQLETEINKLDTVDKETEKKYNELQETCNLYEQDIVAVFNNKTAAKFIKESSGKEYNSLAFEYIIRIFREKREFVMEIEDYKNKLDELKKIYEEVNNENNEFLSNLGHMEEEYREKEWNLFDLKDKYKKKINMCQKNYENFIGKNEEVSKRRERIIEEYKKEFGKHEKFEISKEDREKNSEKNKEESEKKSKKWDLEVD